MTVHEGTSYDSDRTSERLLTVDDAAFRLASSRTSIYRLVRSGQIRAVRVGERIRFRPSDLEAYLNREAIP